MTLPQVVSRQEWLAARQELLVKEDEAAAAREELNARRRALPMVRLDKSYYFEGPQGKVELLDLFEGRRQLIVYHIMFDPSWESGCPHCSFMVDNIGHLAHLHAHDTTLALVSRAPLAKLARHSERMGWSVPWYSSYGGDFNYDFHVTLDDDIAPVEYNFTDKATLLANGQPWFTAGEQPGVSVFLHADGAVFHTYSSYAQGTDLLLGTYNWLDLTPQGSPRDPAKPWLRLHDEY
ncbi:MAG TPA: DUF899 domain-containing protein [Kutzneria sp.]|jgi:predicted dithiol-disulfide oxidoreductase (DUF899 family)|nr:DUF899 domain-containing protein [Kutzneria sp.]